MKDEKRAVDNPRDRRELRRRDEILRSILQAAERVIVSKGFTAMTMDDVAREACLCKATVYKYLPSKGRLLFEIVSHSLDEEDGKIRKVVDSEVPASEKLRAVIAEIVRFLRAKRNIGHMLKMDKSHLKLLRLIHQGGGKARSESFRKNMDLLRRKDLAVMKLVAGIVEQGVADGEFRPVDPMETVSFLYSLFDGIVQPRIWKRGTLDLSDTGLSEKIFSFIYSSIGKRNDAIPERA